MPKKLGACVEDNIWGSVVGVDRLLNIDVGEGMW